MSNLNPNQFGSWMSTTSTDELRDEHDYVRSQLIDFDAKHDPFRKGYPPYKGHGDTLAAHDGIISRGYQSDVNETHAELTKRGETVEPLENIDRDVATVALTQQRGIVADAEKMANGGPLPVIWPSHGPQRVEERRARIRRNLPAVQGHEVDLERHSMGLQPPRPR